MSEQDPHPAWLHPDNDAPDDELSSNEETPLFGTGPLPPDDHSPHDEEAPATYGGVDEQKEEEEEPLNPESWHEDQPKVDKKKSKKSKSKPVLKSKSFQEFLNRPPKPCFLHIFHFVETLATIGCCCLLATQIIPLIIFPIKEIGLLQIALRTYISLFCFIFMLVEWNVPLPFLRGSAIMQTYFSRGFLYTFVGLIGMEEAFAVMVQDKLQYARSEFSVSWASLFMELSSWLIIGIGVIYCLFAILCLQPLRQKLTDDWQAKLKAYHELKAAEAKAS